MSGGSSSHDAVVAENARLRAALYECVAVLDSQEMRDVFAFLHTHGIEYKGPRIDMLKLRPMLGPQPSE